MTDKLIEQIEASRSGKGSGPWTRDMEARILADAEVIKAAEALAEAVDEEARSWSEYVATKVDRGGHSGPKGIAKKKWTRAAYDRELALAAFRQAQARAEKGGE